MPYKSIATKLAAFCVRLAGIDGVPESVSREGNRLAREFREVDVDGVKLYEISCLVNHVAVIAATSKEDALAHVESWEQAWKENSDLIAVSDVEVTCVRDVETDEVEDEAHDVTSKARQFLAGHADREGGL